MINLKNHVLPPLVFVKILKTVFKKFWKYILKIIFPNLHKKSLSKIGWQEGLQKKYIEIFILIFGNTTKMAQYFLVFCARITVKVLLDIISAKTRQKSTNIYLFWIIKVLGHICPSRSEVVKQENLLVVELYNES